MTTSLALLLLAPALQAEPLIDPGRAELGRAWRRLEQALETSAPYGEAAVRFEADFDRATAQFFLRNTREALYGFDSLYLEVARPSAPPAAAAIAASLSLRLEPPVGWVGQPAPPRLIVQQCYEPDVAEPLAGQLGLRLVARSSEHAALRYELPLELDRWGALQSAYELPLPELGAEAASWELVLLDAEGVERAQLEWSSSAESPARARARLVRAASGLVLPAALFPARVSLYERAALLSERPDPEATASMVIDQRELVEQLWSELAQLARGLDPYAGTPGDRWRVFCMPDGSSVPARVHVPTALERSRRHPLVIAFHGMSGDEHVFFEAYGGGHLKTLADNLGFIAVSPSTYAVQEQPQRFDELLEQLLRDYPVDRERVYVLGHSMGAFLTASLCESRQATIARAACFAGGGADALPRVPLLVVAGERDLIVPLSALPLARAAPVPVEVQVLPDRGHTLLVPSALEMAVEWFGLAVPR